MALILYHHNSSVCAAKVRIALAEKGLDWDSRLMALDGDQFDPAYLALNPAAVVPTLVHDGDPIIESNVILEYLDDAFPEPALRPANPFERARMRLWMGQLDHGEPGIHRAISVLTYAIAYRHGLIAEAGGTDPDRLRDVIGRRMNARSRAWLEGVIVDGLAAPSFAVALARMDRLCADFDRWFATSPWLAGRAPSLADIAYTPYVVRLDMLGLSSLWQSRRHLAAWVDRLRARPSTSEATDWYAPATRLALDRGAAAAREAAEHLLDKLGQTA